MWDEPLFGCPFAGVLVVSRGMYTAQLHRRYALSRVKIVCVTVRNQSGWMLDQPCSPFFGQGAVLVEAVNIPTHHAHVDQSCGPLAFTLPSQDILIEEQGGAVSAGG
jgi:hypothetical protein